MFGSYHVAVLHFFLFLQTMGDFVHIKGEGCFSAVNISKLSRKILMEILGYRYKVDLHLLVQLRLQNAGDVQGFFLINSRTLTNTHMHT